MDDRQIVDLYWERNEAAIKETECKYGRYLQKIAFNILYNTEDSEECVNDTYLKAWNSIPPHKPVAFLAYLGKITRELSIDVFRRKNSKKRKGSQYEEALSELEECVSGGTTPEEYVEAGLLADTINEYLRKMSKEARNIFVCRYYFMDSVKEIASYGNISEAKVKSILYRARIGLKEHLEREKFL